MLLTLLVHVGSAVQTTELSTMPKAVKINVMLKVPSFALMGTLL